MGNREWGIGHWAMGIKKTQERNARSNKILSMPHAQLPITHYQFTTLIKFLVTTDLEL
ncbi:hypothetical protein NIES4075_26660 [Tolypothrix sp. NIES-4075]|nr:hypothetical protein NIES4075_26660 [Tolypothrix sp. NIES-4075]